MVSTAIDEGPFKKKTARYSFQNLVDCYDGSSIEKNIAVFSLNLSSILFRLPEEIKETLTNRGYKRLYNFFLFAPIGNFTEFCDKPIEQLIHPDSDQSIRDVMPKVGKVFFAFGEPVNTKIEKLILKRVEDVQNLILEANPEVSLYHFGELSKSGYPKKFEDLKAEDPEIKFL